MNKLWTWGGTVEDWARLEQAIKNNCTCDVNVPQQCSTCRLLTDQKALDTLEFGRTLAERITVEEFTRRRHTDD